MINLLWGILALVLLIAAYHWLWSIYRPLLDRNATISQLLLAVPLTIIMGACSIAVLTYAYFTKTKS